MNKHILIGALCCFAIAHAIPASAQDFLDKKQVTKLFTDQTVESFNLRTGTTSFTYYSPDGKAYQERYWTVRTGQWKVDSNGRMCLSMENKPFSCRHIVKDGKKFFKYRPNSKGKQKKIIRYRQFIQGNALAKNQE